ncbi:MAG: serine protease [Anaerolineae bacterium]|nr:serine protease [Anaerolineae bacterium]
MHYRIVPVLMLLIMFASHSQLTAVYAQQPVLDIERIQRATVFVMQARNVGDDLFVTCVGSGTIVSRDGLILTNAHNTLVSSACPGETLIVAITTRPDEPPTAQYRAEIAQADAGLDLALLRVVRELDGRLIERETLALPFVELADSSTVRIDETIVVAGYPGIGNDPITTVLGTTTGFVTEPRSLGDSAWIKTSAVIPGAMTGGGAYNQNSQLIGIPTTAPLVRNALDATCRPIQDTNRDGLVNTSDDCIAVGGFINALRPANLARPLVRAGSLGLTVEQLTTGITTVESINPPGFKRLFFSPSVNEAGMPTSVISALPAGSTSLYLFFDYENMTPETVYELRVTTDGRPNSTFSLAPVRWSGGRNGMWYIGSSSQPWPNGIYEFTLFANGVAAPTVRLTIGGVPQTGPSFSDIIFGLLDLRGNPLGNGFVLPSGNTASARFLFRNIQNATNWTTIWYLNGAEFTRATNVWAEGAEGSTTTSIEAQSGLPAGSYRLEIYIENSLAATSDFTIAGAQQGALPQIFSNTRFTSANSSEEAIAAPSISNFPNKVNNLYSLFDWQQIAPATLWTMRWLVDGDIFYEQSVPWGTAESGQNFLTRLSNPTGLPDGTYRVELLINNVLLSSTQSQVGIGQLPIDRFGNANGVLMRGQILDAGTEQGIPGVMVIVITEDFSVGEFLWDQNQVYALAVTDRNGFFEVDRPLELSNENTTVAYSAIIAADGYLPINADGITVDAETENPLNMIIYLTRD